MTKTPASVSHMYPHATGAAVLDTPTHNLASNLSTVIQYAVTRSDSARSAASVLGLSGPRQLFEVAAKYGINLPWRRTRKGGR